MVKLLTDELHKKLLGFPADRKIPRQYQDLWLAEEDDKYPDIHLDYPDDLPTAYELLDDAVALLGQEHLDRLELLKTLDSSELAIPSVNFGALGAGWNFISSNGLFVPADLPPSDSLYVFDTETGWLEEGQFLEWFGVEKSRKLSQLQVSAKTSDTTKFSWLPTIAVALRVGEDGFGWYVWKNSDKLEEIQSLIDFSTANTIIGHNVTAYDRGFLKTEYEYQRYLSKSSEAKELINSGHQGYQEYLESFDDTEFFDPTKLNRFWDTMSSWIATRGMGNQQRIAYNLATDEDSENNWSPVWVLETAKNGLSDIYQHYFGSKLDKGVRDEIVEYGYNWSILNSDKVGYYCASDVIRTLEVAQAIYAEWVVSQPSSITKTAALLLGSYYIPLSKDRFPSYHDTCQAITDEKQSKAELILSEIAEDLVSRYQPQLIEIVKGLKGLPRADKARVLAEKTEEFVKTLPQEIQWLDWSIAQTGKNKGLPQWYRDTLKLKDDGRRNLSTKSKIVPALLGLKFKGYPVLWGDLTDYGLEGEEGFYTEDYGYIENPNKENKHTTQLFSKSFVKQFDSGLLSTANPKGSELLTDLLAVSTWVSMQKRVMSLKVHEVPELDSFVVVPRNLATGTLTRRCTDPVFQVLANPKASKVGTEIKTMIEAPKGFKLVGADKDQQEVILSGLIGDSRYGYVGITGLSKAALVGDKKAGTDVHSMAAKAGNVSRDAAKSAMTFSCVPLNSEALTREGWKTYENLSVGQDVLAYDEKTKCYVWTPIEEIFYYNNAPVWQMRTKHNYSFLSTPNHRWLVEKRVESNKTRKYEPGIRTTDSFRHDDRILTSSTLVQTESNITPDEASLLAWLITDGCVSKSKRGWGQASIEQKKVSQRQIIEELLASLGIKISRYDRGDGNYSYCVPVNVVRDLWGKLGSKTYDQVDYVKAVLGMSTTARLAFLEACWLAEGHLDRRGVKIISQNEGTKLEAIELAANLLGYQTRRYNRLSYTGKINVALRLIERDYVTCQKMVRGFHSYQPVWCLRTKFGSWVMRQNGNISITGNSLYGAGATSISRGLYKLINTSKEDCLDRANSFMAGFRGIKNGSRYEGGLASDFFTVCTEIADKIQKTPILKAELPKPLQRTKDFATTRKNWVVQSSGVDERDMWVVILTYLMYRYRIQGRLVVSVHDELWSMVKEEQSYKQAYLFNLSNMICKAVIIDKLALNGIPIACAYHSAVNIDTVCRKEVFEPCNTLSQPNPIEPGKELNPKDFADYRILDDLKVFG